jgi:hypothetical protein
MGQTPDDFGAGDFGGSPPPPEALEQLRQEAELRRLGVPEEMIRQAMTAGPNTADYCALPPQVGPPTPGQWPHTQIEAMYGPRANPAPAPAPPPPTPFPTPDSDCEEAKLQRQDPSRVAQLRADPILFLEKVDYYLSQIAAKRDAARTPEGECDVAQLREVYGAFIDERIESIDCLPGTCPRFNPWSNPPTAEQSDGARVWDACYRLLAELQAQGVCDAEDQAVVLQKLGDRPVPLAPGEDVGAA